VAGVLAVLVVALGVSVAIVVAAPPPPSPSKPPPPQPGDFSPAPPAIFGPKPATPEEERQLRAKIERESSGIGNIVAGPQTAGKTIILRGMPVKLPTDAHVERYILEVLCSGPSCPETPAYVIRRGNSTFAVSEKSGVIIEEHTAPGEERVFDFLREALR
jgi:hypothetical protein